MKKLFQQITCLLLALMLFAGVATARPALVKAANGDDDEYTTLYSSSSLETATAGVAKSHTFTTKTTGALYIDLIFSQPTAFSFQLKAANGDSIDYGTISDTDEYWQPYYEGTAYIYELPYKSAAVGTFVFELTTLVDTSYALVIDQGKPAASISNTNIKITEGFTDKLTIQNPSGKIKWSSSNNKIATVNAKGVVSAKKTGSCIITATTEDNTKLKCKVKVRKNVYTRTKHTNADADNGSVTAYIYKASTDASGNLVCKFRVINNTGNTITKLSDMRISVLNEKKKTVFSYKVGSKPISVSSYKYKDGSITIPKSAVKKCDLVKADIRFTGEYNYYG